MMRKVPPETPVPVGDGAAVEVGGLDVVEAGGAEVVAGGAEVVVFEVVVVLELSPPQPRKTIVLAIITARIMNNIFFIDFNFPPVIVHDS